MSVYKSMVKELLDDQAGTVAEQAERHVDARGGVRPGAGRNPMKPSLKKQKKAFSLSPEAVQALVDLQDSLGLPSRSAVVEFLVLRKIRELQRDLF